MYKRQDSPLAVEATNVFHENVSDCFDEEAMELISAGINPCLLYTSEEQTGVNADLTITGANPPTGEKVTQEGEQGE